MSGFNADDDKATVGKRENGDSGSQQDAHCHRRTKSASNRNSDLRKVVVSHSTEQLDGRHAPTISTRDYGDHSLLPPNSSSNHRASLERDIEQLRLRLQQEKSMRMMLERAMGRVSSTLSPGHRHFATQTKELITEIELLEEEVANREQHVLSLYRNIFEQCVSRTPSERNSGAPSPAHTKQTARKHPRVISYTLCLSNPLKPWNALATINDMGKRNSKSRDDRPRERSHIPPAKTGLGPREAFMKVSAMEINPTLRTLKDHLYQCPSKLSEEMVRCMAAVYCWLCKEDPEKKQAFLLSKSATNAIIPGGGTSRDKDWYCKSVIEIPWISTDKRHISQASYGINNYRLLVEQLEKITLNHMDSDAKLAFWINVYNALVMHAYLAYGIPQNPLRRLALFHKSAYNIGGQIVSANAIEHSIFCFRTPRVGRWLETILSTALRKKSGEERQHISSRLALVKSEPLLCFALCTGAISDPVLKVYTASNIKDELESVKREFLRATVVVKKSRKVFLPKLLERFAREASLTLDDLLEWVAKNVDQKLRLSIKKCRDRKSSKKVHHIIEWLPYSSRFRYVFSEDLTQKR